MITRRRFTQLSAALLPTLGVAPAAWAQTGKDAMPDVARIISGFPAGGTADALARRVGDRMRGQYAGAVMVDNKPGAGGQIGILNLRDSPADGTSLLITPSSMLSIYPYTYPKLRYTLDDVAPVSLGAMFDHGLAVGPGVPDNVRTLADFLAEWYGFFLPGKASADTVKRASQALQSALVHPEVVDYGKQYGLEVRSSTAAQLAQMLKADADQWRGLIKQTGFTAES
eukprot:gene3182-3110_t